jgi:hypothetical protein
VQVAEATCTPVTNDAIISDITMIFFMLIPFLGVKK